MDSNLRMKYKLNHVGYDGPICKIVLFKINDYIYIVTVNNEVRILSFSFLANN
jgi:hypothetical protein